MQITINNEIKETAAKTIAELAAELALPQRGVALAVNNVIAPRAQWESTALSEGDSITVIKAAFGG